MKKKTISLVTGGRWHKRAYEFLLKEKYNIIVLDDNKNCYLTKKFKNINVQKLINIKNYKNTFFWSPCNDLGSHLSDKYNFRKYSTRIKNFIISNNKKKIIEKIRINKLNVKKIKKQKSYIIKPIFGSGSKGIKLYNYKEYNKEKFFIQELIYGSEISAEIYSYRSKHKIISLSLRVLKNYKSAISILTIHPNKKIKNEILKCINKYYNKIGVNYGITHVELKIDKNNKIYPIDINLRMGGAGVSDFFIKNNIKYDPFEIDFNTIFKKKKYKIFGVENYGLLIFENKNCNYLKKRLSSIKHMGYYEKLRGRSVISNSESDENRVALLYLNCKDQNNLENNIKFIFSKKRSVNIINQIKKLT